MTLTITFAFTFDKVTSHASVLDITVGRVSVQPETTRGVFPMVGMQKKVHWIAFLVSRHGAALRSRRGAETLERRTQMLNV